MVRRSQSHTLGLGVLAGVFFAAAADAQPVVSNVRAQQLADGTKRVEVLYDLAGAPAGGATVSVAFSGTGDTPYSIVPLAATLSGDVGAGIASGTNKRIVWDCTQTLSAETYGTTYRAAVTAVDPGGSGQVITIYLGPGSTVPLELMRIPAGTFTMGSPSTERGRSSSETPHTVTVSTFYMGKKAVTQAQWQAVMGTNPASGYGVGADYPVYYVSWDDICSGTTGSSCVSTSFIGKLNQYLTITGQAGASKFRMPTEPEWEHAARAGTTTEFSFAVPASWDTECGSFEEAAPYMWWCNNASSTEHPVGQKLANPWGLFDMHGNVWEWVADWYGTYPTWPQMDPPGPVSGSYRVIRGGSWYNTAETCRSATRNYRNPGSRSYYVGFRLARSQ